MTPENQVKAQYTFDTIATHLLVQGQPSMGIVPNGFGGKISGCAYRGDHGLRCAVGFCISNESYRADLEGKTAWSNEVLGAISPQYCNDGEFLSDLQTIHDTSVGLFLADYGKILAVETGGFPVMDG